MITAQAILALPLFSGCGRKAFLRPIFILGAGLYVIGQAFAASPLLYDGKLRQIYLKNAPSSSTRTEAGLHCPQRARKNHAFEPPDGKIRVPGQHFRLCPLRYFPFEVQNPDRIAGESSGDCAVSMSVDAGARAHAAGSGHGNLERPFLTLSNGERTKLLLAALFLRENHFLLIDEPTNHWICTPGSW
jgi:lincosamide and streptogramin A transport system ATP-binding/permease protein